MSERLAPVELEFQLETAENVRALRWHVVQSGGLRWTAPAAAAASTLFAAALYANGWSWTISLAVGGGTLAAVALATVVVFPWIAVRRSPQLTRPHRFVFTDRGVRFESGDSEGELGWERYHRWRHNDEFFFLYYDDDQFTLVPRRAFEESDSERRFAKLLDAKIRHEA